MLPYCLSNLAGIDVAERRYERAATLLSVADAMMTRQGNAWPADEAPHFEESRSTTGRGLGAAEFHQAWSRGQQLPVPGAVALALGARAG